jgi:hypothetical protein
MRFQPVIGFVDFTTLGVNVTGQDATASELRQGLMKATDSTKQVDKGQPGSG